MTWLVLLFAFALAASFLAFGRRAIACAHEEQAGALRSGSRDAGRRSLIGQALGAGADGSTVAEGGFCFGVRLCEADGGAKRAFGFNLSQRSVDCAERNCRYLKTKRAPRATLVSLRCPDAQNWPRIALRASADCRVGGTPSPDARSAIRGRCSSRL